MRAEIGQRRLEARTETRASGQVEEKAGQSKHGTARLSAWQPEWIGALGHLCPREREPIERVGQLVD